MANLEVGSRFSSYDELQTCISELEKTNLMTLWKRESKTLQNVMKRCPSVMKAPLELKYYMVKYACLAGGREHKKKCTDDSRVSKTFRQNCPVFILVMLSDDKSFLEVKKMNLAHNHAVSVSLFSSLPKQRKLPAEYKEKVKNLMNLQVNKKLLQEQILKETGKTVTLKDLSNIAAKGENNTNFEELLMDPTQCQHCGKFFSYKSNVRKHIRCVHKIQGSSAQTFKCLESDCGRTFNTGRALKTHLSDCHKLEFQEIIHNFDSMNQFNEWKNLYEEEHIVNFVKSTGIKKGEQNGVKRYYYICHQSGSSRIKLDAKKHRKSYSKMGYKCTASLTVVEKIDGTVTCTMCATHYGHSKEVGKVHLTENEKKLLADKLAEKNNSDDVLNDISQNISSEQPKRIHLTTKQDLANIRRKFGIPRPQCIRGKRKLIRETSQCGDGRTDFHNTSGTDDDNTSYDVDNTFYEGDNTSYVVDNRSYDVDNTSYVVDNTCYDADQESTDAVRQLLETGINAQACKDLLQSISEEIDKTADGSDTIHKTHNILKDLDYFLKVSNNSECTQKLPNIKYVNVRKRVSTVSKRMQEKRTKISPEKELIIVKILSPENFTAGAEVPYIDNHII